MRYDRSSIFWVNLSRLVCMCAEQYSKRISKMLYDRLKVKRIASDSVSSTHSHHEGTRHCILVQWQFISSSIYGVLSGKQLCLTAPWTYSLTLTLQRSVGVRDEIRGERTYSPAPWLIFTVKDNRQCPTAHNANFWHISVNFMPNLWWHAVTSVTVHHSSHWVMLHWRWYSADNTNNTSSLCRDTDFCIILKHIIVAQL